MYLANLQPWSLHIVFVEFLLYTNFLSQLGDPDKQGLWARVCTVPVRSGQTSSVYLEPKVYFVATVLLTAGNQERLVSRAPHWRLESFDKFTRGTLHQSMVVTV